MVKYLSCPDLHRSPVWSDVSRKIEAAILKAAVGMDFVLMPGDYWDAPVYASDKGGINEAIDFFLSLSAICPVYAIEGTPSHDAPGSYGPLPGVTIVRAGEMYNNGKALIFGIPEPGKSYLQAGIKETSAERVNAMVTEIIGHIITDQIAPKRAMHPDLPAIGMYHGNVSDAMDRAAETDVILKASDIVIKTDTLALAGLTRWELGHIHTPWESKKISAGYAGYAGIDRNPWGKTGFIPAMNMVTISDDGSQVIERVPYGTPMRVKITSPLDEYDPSVAYWLVSKNIGECLPDGLHPWSRTTYDEESTVSRRVSAKEIEESKSLTDLAKLFNPNITEEVLSCFRELEDKVKRSVTNALDTRVTWVRIKGADFWKGRTAEFSISELDDGLTQISGGNGSGKSSISSFCSPYPCVIGKDTESGRLSAIKDFFSSEESSIEKTVILNGVKHDHLITIKGAHTKNPKTECYLTIDGQPALEKATFDEMMAKCEQLYGPLSDYMMTSFYVQPLQGKAESGLMTASMTTIRDLVQNIAGIDYSRQKDYALAKFRELEKAVTAEELKIQTERNLIGDPERLESQIADNMNIISVSRDSLKTAEVTRNAAKETRDAQKMKKDTMDERRTRKKAILEKIAGIQAGIADDEKKAAGLKDVIEKAPLCRFSLAKDADVKKEYSRALAQSVEVEKRNNGIKLAQAERDARVKEIDAKIREISVKNETDYRDQMGAWERAKTETDAIAQANASITREIELIKKPCVNCGYLDPGILDKISALESRMKDVPALPPAPVRMPDDIPGELTERKAELLFMQFTPEEFTLPPSGLTGDEIASLNAIITSADKADAERDVIVTKIIPGKKSDIASLQTEADGISFEDIDITLSEKALADAENVIAGLNEEITRCQTTIKHLRDNIDEIKEKEVQLQAREIELEKLRVKMNAWKETDTMMSPSKIPAMELESVLDNIDAEATRNIEPYRSGIYLFKTLTQKGGVDKFDIIVHDATTGAEKSFLKYSVGEKSMLNDAYTKALTHIRSCRMRTTYSPIILDEADSFVDIPSIPEYYAIQKSYYMGKDVKVLVVSHSPDAGNYIQNKIDMKEIVCQ